MNREIKFRAWHNRANKMLESGSSRQIFSWKDEGQDITIMQYVGLTDKNGKEIYEGDIVKKDSGDIRRVEWNQQNSSFWLMSEWHNLTDFPEQLGNGYFSRKDCEVIGNIYETAELIKN